MKSKIVVEPIYEGIQRIGIPRALLYYRYGVFWKSFFEALGVEVILSPPTTKRMVEAGEALAVDECCLASKIYFGHVAYLLDQGCETVFVPGILNQGLKHEYCTRFQSLPDLVSNMFRGNIRVVTCMVELKRMGMDGKNAFTLLAMRFNIPEKQARKIVKQAWSNQAAFDKKLARAQELQVRKLQKNHEEAMAGHHNTEPKDRQNSGIRGLQKRDPLRILVVTHPYIAYDEYLGGQVIRIIESLEAVPLLAVESDKTACFEASLAFSQTMPWEISRELIGSILTLRDRIDGVILISAFPCGPDSMTNDAVMRCITGLPLLSLIIDSQSGTAGLETRIESFLDILRFKRKGGYAL